MINSPKENDFIDIHSHKTDKEKNVFRIFNTSSTDFPTLLTDQPISVGLHPWHINDSAMEILPDILENSLKLPRVKAVGETGLDRLIRINMEKQEAVFITHIKFALEFNKPLIIHCVRAYSDLIRLKKHFGSKISWIIHGYNGNENIAKELITEGFFISLGNRLLRNEDKILRIRGYIPLARIFIETDEVNIRVRDLYSMVAELYKTDVESLQKTILNNYKAAFNS